MMDVKAELRYLLVTRTLEDMAQAGFLSEEELAVARGLAQERYRPATVWES